MSTVLWYIQVVLAAVFLASGALKLVQGRDRLRPRMAWVEDRTDVEVRTIGGLEILGAAGLVLPGLLYWPSVLTPLAGLGLVLTMAGAALVHVQRKETAMLATPIVLLVLAAGVAWGRFGPYPL